MQAAKVELMKLEVELASGALGVAAGVIVFVVEIDVGPRVELAMEVMLLLEIEAPKPLATELASDKMQLQIAGYAESSEKGTMLQVSPERVVVVVVVVVVAVAEHPSTVEQVILPKLDVTVVSGLVVMAVFHVEHG